MAHSLYGIDVKINVLNRPVAIEMNGVDFGTDFFKYAEGLDYYRKFAATLKEHVDGPVFINSSLYRPQQAAGNIGEIDKLYGRMRNSYGNYSKKMKGHLSPEYSWLDDFRRFEKELAGKPPEKEEFFYQWGGREEGLEIYPYVSMSAKGGNFHFRLANGKMVGIRENDIGLIIPGSSVILDGGQKTAGRYPNSEYLETLLAHKPLFRFVLNMAYSEEMSQVLAHFPLSMNYGMGVAKPARLLDFLNQIRPVHELVVKKRGSGSCGIGVAIMRTEDAIREAEGFAYGGDAAIHYANLIMNDLVFPEDLITVYEGFHHSKPIKSLNTGRLHDGCARIAVFRPEGEDPIAIDGQWRLCPLPLDSNGPLEGKYRANLSRGAFAEPLSGEDKEMLFPFSEMVVSGFEEAAARVYEAVGAGFEGMGNLSRGSLMRMLFWHASILEANYSPEQIDRISALCDENRFEDGLKVIGLRFIKPTL